MKTKFSGILTLLLAFVVQMTFAQERTITGTVSDESGPLPGVSVLIDGTTIGTETDFDGNYSISAASGQSIRFSFVGMTTVIRAVGTDNVINVTMVSEENTLDEVVVTALGIAREKKSLGYATQEVKGDAVNTAKDPNFVNSLSGKVAGVDVKASGTMGGSSNVVIRGYSSLYNSNQALFVVDGVPVSNTNSNSSNQTTGRGGYDYGNAAQDINPDDIESVNVLKGGAATALYGSRAANGVIVVTTKKGKDRGNKGIGVTVNSSVTFNKYDTDTFVKYQKEYGAGYSDYYYDAGGPGGAGFLLRDVNGDGIDDLATPSTEDASFGAIFDPNLLIYQWDSWYPDLDTYQQARPWVGAKNDPNSYFQTGTTLFNSVALDGANEKSTFRLGYSNMNQEGILENSSIIRDNINFNGSYNFTDKLTVGIAANYAKTKGKGRYGTGYDSNNPMQQMRQWWQTNVDVKEQRAAYFATGKNITWNPNDPVADLSPIYSDNPYWTRYVNYESDVRNRVFGNVHVSYDINEWLNVFGRVTMDTYAMLQEERTDVGSSNIPGYTRYNANFTENNFDLMLNFDRDLTEKLNIRGTLGMNILTQRFSSIFASTNGGLKVAGLFSLSNSLSTLSAPTEGDTNRRTDGYYVNASLGYDNLFFLDASYRIDKASTLPRDNDTYNYYGVSGSFLFSTLLNSNAISLGKIRAGVAQTGNSPRNLSVYNVYGIGDNTATGQGIASLPSTGNNPELKPEISNEWEVGLEMAFARNRLGFDVSYYDKVSKDLITPIQVTPATGYTGLWANAGEISNKGFEVSLFGSPIRTDNFEWRIDINWAKNESEVLSLPSGLDNLQLTSLQGGVSINATIGQPYGMIQGSDFVYLDGKRVITPDGYYQKTASTSENLGSYQPEWTGGINNRFSYKNLTFSFLIDMQEGGSVFSLDTWYGYATGLYAGVTTGNNDQGNPMRNTLANGGGLLLDGVQADGTPNTVYGRMDYYGNGIGYARAPNALHVYDAGFIKLREMTLGYKLPQKMLGNGFIQGLEFTAIGRNLWIIDKNTPFTDPEAGLSSGNVQGYQSGAYPATKDYGFSVKLQF